MISEYYIDKIPVPITITKNDILIFVNKEIERLTGYKKEELIGKEIHFLYPSLYEFEEIKRLAEKIGEIRGVRAKLKKKNGEIINIIIHINLLEYKDGATGGIGAAFDITHITEEEERLQKSLERLHLLYSTLKTISSSLNIDEIIKKVVEIIKDYFKLTLMGISLVTEENKTKYSIIEYFIGYEKENIERLRKIPLIENRYKTAITYAIYTGKINYIPDTTKLKDKYYYSMDPKVRSCLVIPIKFKDQILGAIVLESYEVDRFSKGDIELLQTIMDMLGTIIANAKLYEKALYLSIRDPLTEVYNHRYFYEKLREQIARYKRYKETFSLAIIDLDNFKRINDTYGHLKGDEILQKFAKILKDNTREQLDIICRYGGDEFSIIFINTKLEEAITIANRLMDEVEKNKEQLLGITISIGLAEYKGEESKDIMAKVDAITYKAKKKGGKRVEIG